MKKILAAAFLAVLCLGPALVSAQQLTVEKLAVGRDVKKNVLLGEAASFPGDVGQVYCWAKIAAQPRVSLKIIWKVDNVVMSEITIQTSPKETVLTAFKRVWAGNWSVEIQDERKNVVSSVSFRVG